MLTALAAGSSIALNFGHPYLPLEPPPRWLVAAVYGVPPVCAPFAWHLFLRRVAHRRQHPRHTGQDATVLVRPEQPAGQDAAGAPPLAGVPGQDSAGPTPARPLAGQDATEPAPVPASTPQDGQPARAVVRGLLAREAQDAPLSWRDVTAKTGLSRSRAYTLLREDRARLARTNGHPPAAPHLAHTGSAGRSRLPPT